MGFSSSERVRQAYASAIVHDRARVVLLQRQMRAAGLPAHVCSGPNNPVATWATVWVASGFCTLRGGVPEQLLLPDCPEFDAVTDPLAATRLCPSDAMAPPAVLPHDCIQAFITSDPASAAFGVAVVEGGDADRDGTARHLADAAGRVTTVPTDPAFVGASRRARPHAELSAAVAVLETHSGGPLLLRFSDSAAPRTTGSSADCCRREFDSTREWGRERAYRAPRGQDL